MVQCPGKSRPTNPETRDIGYNNLAEDLQRNVSFLYQESLARNDTRIFALYRARYSMMVGKLQFTIFSY